MGLQLPIQAQPQAVDVSKLIDPPLGNDPSALFVKEGVARLGRTRRALTGLWWTLRIVVGAVVAPFVIPVHQVGGTILSLLVAVAIGVDSVIKTDKRIAKYTLALGAIVRTIVSRKDGKVPPEIDLVLGLDEDLLSLADNVAAAVRRAEAAVKPTTEKPTE